MTESKTMQYEGRFGLDFKEWDEVVVNLTDNSLTQRVALYHHTQLQTNEQIVTHFQL